MEQKKLSIFTQGEVGLKDGRKFTRLVGGFGEDKPMFMIWQAGELLGCETREIAQNFKENKENFEEQIDFVDFKSAISGSDNEQKQVISTLLAELEISQNKMNATKQWLAFSLSGMMKLVKISKSQESWDIYNAFLEDYFKTKAENVVMKRTLQEEIQFLNEQRANTLGRMFMEKGETKKFELFQENEKLNNRILEIEKRLSEEKLAEHYKDQLAIADKFTNGNYCYDMGSFAKVLGIKGLGRNNMFEWLRNKEILMSSNQPYQRYTDYFNVVVLEEQYGGRTSYKTLVKPKGVSYIVKKLIEDGRMQPRSIDSILNEMCVAVVG